MKKIFKIFIVLVSFLPLIYVNASSFDLNLNVDKTEVVENEQVVVKFSGTSIPDSGLSSGQFYISYDSEFYDVSCDNVTYHQGILSSEVDCNSNDSRLILLYVDSETGETPIKNEEIASVVFKVKSNIGTQETSTFTLSGEGFATIANGSYKNLNLSSTYKKNTIIKKIEKPVLSKLEVVGYDISFSKEKYEYSFEVKNDVSTIEINAEADNNMVIEGTGVKSLSVGNNKLTIIVTSESGGKQEYVLNVKRMNIEGTVDSPPTGLYSYLAVFILMIICGIFSYKKIIKRDKFTKI